MKIRILLIAVSLTVGATVGFLWASQWFKQFEVANELDLAAHTGMDSVTLAQLRLSETTHAIADLENRMEVSLGTLAAWDPLAPPSPDVRKRRDQWLTSAKVYHPSFPVKSDDTNLVARVNPFLEKIPGRSPTST